ncbi:MAG: hypothetical protein ABW019_14060 [Chitinophagaceae bacterium]
MRYLLPLSLLAFCSGLMAQQNFEGTIRYRMVSPDSAVLVNISAWYGKNRILFTTAPEKAPPGTDLKAETILLDFRKAAIDRYKPNDKVVEREFMTRKGKKQDIPALTMAPALAKQVLGHPCTARTTGRFSKSEQKDSVTVAVAGEMVFWYADDLIFRVPDSLLMVQMVPLFTNGHIALGSKIKIEPPGMRFVLHTEAKEIKPGRLRRTVFRHPKGYRLRHNE